MGLDDVVHVGSVTITGRQLLEKAEKPRTIFLSYAREDRERARSIYDVLSQNGWLVWWDDRISIGASFDEEIEHQLKESICVVVLWSRVSIESQWVRAEAGLALEMRKLIPLFIDRVEAPLLFRQIQGAFASEWQGTQLRSDLGPFIEKLQRLVGDPH